MTPEQRARALAGLNSIVGQSEAAQIMKPPAANSSLGMAEQFGEPSLAQQVAAEAARKGWLSPSAAPASPSQPGTPSVATVHTTPAPEAWTGIINHLTGDDSDYTADPATARAFGRLFPSGPMPASGAQYRNPSSSVPAVPTLAQSLAGATSQRADLHGGGQVFRPVSDGSRYMMDGDGKIYFTPHYQTQVDKGIPMDWGGVANDLATIGLGSASAARGVAGKAAGALLAGLKAWGGGK